MPTPTANRAAADRGPRVGRPPVTTHAEIERVAFALFEQRGFEATTLDDIATALGVGRRTLFRYYASKNDIPWGHFDDSLRRFERTLVATPEDVPVAAAVRLAILAFNELPPEAVAQHRQRMRFLLTTPALLAHSELRYTAWRDVVARYVAARTGRAPDDLLPSVAGRASLGVALAAYERWLHDESADLPSLLSEAFEALEVVIISHSCS